MYLLTNRNIAINWKKFLGS